MFHYLNATFFLVESMITLISKSELDILTTF
jgi:hypothetical protein